MTGCHEIMRYNNGGISSLQQLSEALSLLKHCYRKWRMSVSSLLLRDCSCGGATMAEGQERVTGFCKIHSCPFALKRGTLGIVHTSEGPHCPVAQGTDPSSCLKGISKRNVGQIPRTGSWTAKKLNFNGVEDIPPQSHIKIIKIEF